jgi:hypothetical protein
MEQAMTRVTTTALLMALASVAAVTIISQAGEQKQPGAGEKPKTYQGLSATLALAGPECKTDGPLEVTFTLASAGESHRLFNPFLNGLLEQPGRLVIRDGGGRVVNRLLDFRGGRGVRPARATP